ncbi:hypothetical protein H1C71_008081, partial [Ictidomys tridecemlineatus]
AVDGQPWTVSRGQRGLWVLSPELGRDVPIAVREHRPAVCRPLRDFSRLFGAEGAGCPLFCGADGPGSGLGREGPSGPGGCSLGSCWDRGRRRPAPRAPSSGDRSPGLQRADPLVQ